LQLINAGVSQVDAILFTHDHADHVHGIDDIRALSDKSDVPIEMYGPPDSMARLAKRFAYIFDESIKALPGTSKPEGSLHAVPAGKTFRIGDVDVLPVSIPHGPITVYGYRIGNLGYVTDAKELPDEAVKAFRGVDVMVLNALFRTQHPTHLSISEAVSAAQKVGARETWLTHLTHRTSHAELEAELPRGIAPAYDGLTVEVA
jgi:phosphoribosyl 1,2-cyclic phosphate phosphodiesterase